MRRKENALQYVASFLWRSKSRRTCGKPASLVRFKTTEGSIYSKQKKENSEQIKLQQIATYQLGKYKFYDSRWKLFKVSLP